MFSSVKYLILGRSFLKICCYCTKNKPNVGDYLRNLRQNCVEKCYQSRFVSSRSSTVVNAVASDSEREDATDSDEEVGYRKKPPQIKVIYEVVKKSKILSEEELIKFKENVLSIGNVVNEANIDAIVLGICSSFRNIEFADGYLEVLKQRGSNVNVATLAKYMKLCHACGHVKDEGKVLDVWHSLSEKLPLMDASTAESVILGLSVTSEWKRGLELLSMVKETSAPSALVYSALIVSAFRKRDIQVGWDLMEECLKEEKPLLETVYHAWLDEYCTLGMESGVDQCLEMTEKLLNFLSCNEIIVSMEVSKKLKNIFEKMKWRCRYTSVDERGWCKTCKGEMRPIFISRSEFQNLSQTFLEKVLVGPDIFSNSSPEEVKGFQELIANNAPYNTVIDGLNVAYSAGTEARASRPNPAAVLQSVVAHFVDLSHKILVLGRSHMNAWPRKEMDYIRKNSQLFLAENISQDDPFLLYAAMSSGPGTCFLSRDLMRGHAFRLKRADPSLAAIFRRWQISHQMRLLSVSANNRVNIKLPLEFSPTVQKVDGKWHIPCQEVEDVPALPEEKSQPNVPRSHLDPPTTWLCLSPRDHEAQSHNNKFHYSKKPYGNRKFQSFNEWN